MINRRLLVIGLGVLIFIAIIGYIYYFKFGIDFEGGIIVNINSNSSLNIPYSHQLRTFGDVYIYEIPITLDENIKNVVNIKNDLIDCIRISTNLSECNNYLERLEKLSGIEYSNQSYISYAEMVYEMMVNKSISNIINNIQGGSFEYTANVITPTLSKELFSRIISIFILGMLLSTIYIILTFKTWFPTINILSGALIDAFVTIGLITILGFEIDLSVLVGLLVLFGYSLDTSVLLVSNYYYTRKLESIDESMKTGISMISSSLLVFIIILSIGTLLNISFLKNIAIVMIIGLIVDFFTSWGYNAYLIQKFGEKYA